MLTAGSMCSFRGLCHNSGKLRSNNFPVSHSYAQNFAIAIQVQPQFFGALALVNAGQIWFYAQ